MKKKLLVMAMMLVLTFICQYILGLSWWIVFIIPFILCFLFITKETQAFFLSFVTIFLLWFFAALSIDHYNESLLSSKLGALFMGIGSIGFIILSGLFGGLLAGLGGWMGTLTFKIINKE